jgi:hypothetical protein
MNVKRDAKTGRVYCPKCNASGFKPNKHKDKKFMVCSFCEYKAELPTVDYNNEE